MNSSEKLLEQLNQIESALRQVKEALDLEPTQINKDGTIQRFEFTYELAWRLMQECARFQGREVNSPRQAIRVAGELGLIDSVEAWLSYISARNLTTHTYQRSVADEVYSGIGEFYQACVDMAERVKSLLDDRG